MVQELLCIMYYVKCILWQTNYPAAVSSFADIVSQRFFVGQATMKTKKTRNLLIMCSMQRFQRKSCNSNNGFLSEKFKIQRSTRQGCPLSPLIFILALELLFIAIWSDSNIRGVKVEGEEIKLSAFADDTSYFVKDESAARTLLSTIETFS